MLNRNFAKLLFLVTFVTVKSDTALEKANKNVKQHESSVNQTYKPKYHFSPPYGWINDPNGFIQFRGEYHLFYQYNPYGTTSGNIHWGHAKSKDLVHWEDLPIALAPDQSYDINGCFSGSSIEKDGKLYLMYTGLDENQLQVQNVAVSEDGITFEKIKQNPVISTNTLPSNAVQNQFRDPKVYQNGDKYAVILASQTIQNTGQILLYESSDLIKWQLKSTILEGNQTQGTMWECPDLFNLDGKDILMLSPIEYYSFGDDFQNFDSNIAFIGQMDWNNGKFLVENIKEIDHGLDFYASQTLLDDKKRRIAITWMNMWYRNYPTSDSNHGWTGSMTLPRQLRIINGVLKQLPIQTVSDSYKNSVKHDKVSLIDEMKQFNGVSGDVGHLKLIVDVSKAEKFTIKVHANEEQCTDLWYEVKTQQFTLDRTHSGYDITGSEEPPLTARRVQVPLQSGKLELEIFLDKSSVEVFINGGIETLTATVYPKILPSNGIKFLADGNVVIDQLEFDNIKV